MREGNERALFRAHLLGFIIIFLFFFSPGTADKELVSLMVQAIGFVSEFFFDYNYYFWNLKRLPNG